MKRIQFFLLGLLLSNFVMGQNYVGVSPYGSLNIVRGGNSIHDEPLGTISFSDVDVDIPKAVMDSNYHVHVLIIANQNYLEECHVETALNDGRIMREYCVRMLGIPEEQVTFKSNCTSLQMKRAIMDFARDMEFNSKKDDLFLFFYFGHGVYNPESKENDGGLLPVDGRLDNIRQDGVGVKWMIKEQFEKRKPSRLVVYLENSTCKSNIETYHDRMVQYRPLLRRLDNTSHTITVRNNNAAPSFILEPVPDDNFKGNIVVISASSNNETAYSLTSQNHNVFTYEFLKSLKQGGCDITLGELFDNTIDATSNTAWRELRCEQRPVVTVSSSLGNAWRTWKLSMK